MSASAGVQGRAGRYRSAAGAGVLVGAVAALSMVVALSTRVQRSLAPIGPTWLDDWFRDDAVGYLPSVRSAPTLLCQQQPSIALLPCSPTGAHGLDELVGDLQLHGRLFSVLLTLQALACLQMVQLVRHVHQLLGWRPHQGHPGRRPAAARHRHDVPTTSDAHHVPEDRSAPG